MPTICHSQFNITQFAKLKILYITSMVRKATLTQFTRTMHPTSTNSLNTRFLHPTLIVPSGVCQYPFYPIDVLIFILLCKVFINGTENTERVQQFFL